LLSESAGKNFEDCFPFLKITSNDKKPDVRAAFYATIFKLVTNLNIIHLRKYEFQLVMFLMNGLGDDQADIITSCGKFLEDAGAHRQVNYYIFNYKSNFYQKLAVELNEDEDVDMKVVN